MKLRKVLIASLIFSMCLSNKVLANNKFENRANISSDKVWTVKFNFGLNKNTINDKNVYVTDTNGKKVNVNITPGKEENTIEIVPVTGGYVPAKTYVLNLETGVESIGGKNLKEPLKMQFTIEGKYKDESDYINLPKVTNVKMEKQPILPGETQTFYLSSTGASHVEYRIFISRYTYNVDKFEDFQEVTNGYIASNKITLNKTFESSNEGEKYKVIIYVKRAGQKGLYKDELTDFDNYYVDYFRCVDSKDVSNITSINYDKTIDEVLDKQSIPSVSVTDEGPSGWVGASRNQIKYYLNPENFMDEYGKYMFLKLSYVDDSITAEDINGILKGKGILEDKGQAFLEAGKTHNINPVYLASHALLETGNGTSKLANGIEVTGADGKKKVYNMFGIKAFDQDPNKYGSEFAYEQKWFTPEDAIIGGAKYIAEKYVNNTQSPRETLYEMRWNPYTPGSYQYATDIGWAYKQVKNIKDLMDKCKNPTLIFKKPVYKK